MAGQAGATTTTKAGETKRKANEIKQNNNKKLERVEPVLEARNLPQLLSGSCHNSVNGRAGQKTCPATPPFRDVINEWQAAGLALALAPADSGQWPEAAKSFDGDK